MLDDVLFRAEVEMFKENISYPPAIIPEPVLTDKARTIVEATNVNNLIAKHGINAYTILGEKSSDSKASKLYAFTNDWLIGAGLFGQMTDEVAVIGEQVTGKSKYLNMHRNSVLGIVGNIAEIALATKGLMVAQTQIPLVEYSAEIGAGLFYMKNLLSIGRNIQRLTTNEGPALPAWGTQSFALHSPYLTVKAGNRVKDRSKGLVAKTREFANYLNSFI